MTMQWCLLKVMKKKATEGLLMMKWELLQVSPHGCERFLLGGHIRRERKRQRVICSKRFGEMERSCFLLLHNVELIFFSRMFEEFTKPTLSRSCGSADSSTRSRRTTSD